MFSLISFTKIRSQRSSFELRSKNPSCHFVRGVAMVVICMTASVLGMARVSFAKPPVTHDFRVVAVEVGGTKFWFPSVFVVKKGDKVRFHAVSKIPGKNNAHGFKIQAFNIEGVVGEKEEIFEFDANQEGIFSILCHMHPAHIGGQLVVQAK